MKYDLFILKSLKVLSGGVTIKYQKIGETAIITYEDSGRPSHPDLTSIFEKVGRHFDGVFGLVDIGSTVKGINFRGETIQVTGMIEAQNGSMCSLNTPFFSIVENEFELDDKDLLEDLDEVKKEAYSYIFSLKSAQKAIEFKQE